MDEQKASTPETSQRSVEQVLAEVNLTPEAIKGSKILLFGNESNSMEGRVEEAVVSTFDINTYVTFDELVPEGMRMDWVLSVGNKYLTGDSTNDDNNELLVAAIGVLKDDGELRIALPASDTIDQETGEGIRENIARVLYDRNIDATVNYQEKTEQNNPYLSIKPQSQPIV